MLIVSRVSKTNLRVDDLLEGITELRKVVLFMAMVYYNERMKIEISTGKIHVAKVQGKPGSSFQVLPLSVVVGECPFHPSMMCDNMCEVVNQRNSLEPWYPVFLLGISQLGISIFMWGSSPTKAKLLQHGPKPTAIKTLLSDRISQGRSYFPGASRDSPFFEMCSAWATTQACWINPLLRVDVEILQETGFKNHDIIMLKEINY